MLFFKCIVPLYLVWSRVHLSCLGARLVCLVLYLHITSKRKFTLGLEISGTMAIQVMNKYSASCLLIPIDHVTVLL